jgi:hypothetical protein
MTVAQFNVRSGSVRSKVLQYARQHAGEWGNIDEARDALLIAIPDLTKANYSVIRPDILRIMEDERRGRKMITTKEPSEELPEPVAENGHFEMPSDLNPQGLAAIMGLLNKISSLEQEAVGKQAEFGAIQGTLIKTNRTMGMLKDLIHKLVDAL